MNNDINKYYLSLIQEISTRQLSNEDGDNQEQTFTRYVFDVLSEAGETENATVAFDEKDTSIVEPFASCAIMDILVVSSVILEDFYEH